MQGHMRGWAAAAAAVLSACSGGGGSSPPPPPPPPPPAPANVSPIAQAGADQTAIERTEVFFDASESSDPDGQVQSYAWVQLSGPTAVLQEADTAEVQVTAPETDSPAQIVLRVTVTDNDGAQASDEVSLDVTPDPIDDATVVALTVDGLDRTYTLYEPTSYAAGGRAYMALHGGGGSMRALLNVNRTSRRWVAIAERDGALLIVPNGFDAGDGDGLGDDQNWNDIRNETGDRTHDEDDVAFLLAVLDDAAIRAGYDPDRLYVAGSSNGGIMTMTLLIQTPDRFAGGAAFIAALPEEPVPDPPSPTPFMMLNGTLDPLILYFGGPVAGTGAPTRSVPDTTEYWTRVTGSDLSTQFFMTLPNTDVDDNCRITVEEYRDAPGGENTFFYYEAIGGGHTVPDPTPPRRPPAADAVLGPTCRDAHGIDLAADFFLSLE